MNERIRLLAEQAGMVKILTQHAHEYGAGTFEDTEYPELEKFAELIVRECVGITDDLVNRNVDGSWTSNELYTDYNGALFEVKRRIQEHFGVEE
jgi:hypothetical protein